MSCAIDSGLPLQHAIHIYRYVYTIGGVRVDLPGTGGDVDAAVEVGLVRAAAEPDLEAALQLALPSQHCVLLYPDLILRLPPAAYSRLKVASIQDPVVSVGRHRIPRFGAFMYAAKWVQAQVRIVLRQKLKTMTQVSLRYENAAVS